MPSYGCRVAQTCNAKVLVTIIENTNSFNQELNILSIGAFCLKYLM